MDVDISPDTTSGGQGTMSKADEEASAEMLKRLEAISASPYDFDLHTANIAAARSSDEKEESRAFMSSMLALPEELWIDWIQEKLDQPDPTLEASIEILELYKRACQDSLSIRLHTDYATYVVSLFYKARGLTIPDASQDDDEAIPDEKLLDAVAAGVFTEEFVRDELETAISSTVRYHLTEGQRVWLVQHNFELDQLKKARSPEAVDYMHQLYLRRLSEPHLQILETHQMFSTFVSTYLAADYEGSMVAAQKILNGSQKLVGPRERKEDQLAKSNFNSQAFGYYIEWELEVKHPHVGLVRTLYERALALHPQEVSLWTGYAEFLKQAYTKGAGKPAGSDLKVEEEDVVNVCNRIPRSIPASGPGAACAVRTMESLPDSEQANTFSQSQLTRALETSTFDGRLEDFVEAVTACADLARHRVDLMGEEDDSRTEHIDLLIRATEKLRPLTKEAGDPLFRLEKYLIRAYERASRYDQAETFLDKLAKQYPSSSSLVLLRVDFEIKRGDIHAARKQFIAATKRRIDYPEYTYDAWIAFEHREGTLENLQKALDTVKHEMKFVLARRQKEAAKQAKVEALAASANQNTDAPVNTSLTDAASADSSTQPPSNKRAASEGIPVEEHSVPAAKKTKPNQEEAATTEIKRDRENATILVSQLPPETTEAELKNLFRDCGRIREVKIKQFDNQTVATIEFIAKDAVPAAITKDKKRIGDSHEISVVPDWKSTLYVTNFPETYKMEDLQALFEPFGTIFDTRWPSKRFKSSRRFAYVQFVSSTSAEAALQLHNTQPGGDSEQRMQVKLSDPTRAVARTDANANRREIYVTGLSRYTTADDLKKLFKDFGVIKGARVGQDEEGNCKGFGFVDFENEAEATSALSMNNKEYKKKRLAVVLADSKVTAKTRHPESGLGKQSDTRLRSVRVTKLPTTAQEPLIQQIFESFGEIEAVLTEQAGEAVVVFKDAAVAGRLLLHTEPILYEGEAVAVAEEKPRTGAPGSQATRGRGGGNATFLPRSGRGRGRGTKLGIGAGPARKAGGPKPAEAAPSVNGNTSTKSEGGTRSQSDFKALLKK